MKMPLVLACILIACEGSLAMADTNAEPWKIVFDDRQWEEGYVASQDGELVIEYVLAGENVENWTELLTSYVKGDMADFDEGQWLVAFIASIRATNPDLKWSLLSKVEDDLVFEWSHGGNRQWPAQHEIKRLTKRDGDLYSLSYVKKTQQLDEKQRSEWIDNIQKSVLENPAKVQHRLVEQEKEEFRKAAKEVLGR